MSHEHVVGFLEQMHSNPELQERVGRLQGDGGPESVRQLLQLAAEAGFPFTEQELDDLFLAMAANEAGAELTAEQLEAVAGGADMLAATEEMQEMNQSFSLQYLQLQQDIQAENRQFTLVSNIMKVKHDTAKSAINNIR